MRGQFLDPAAQVALDQIVGFDAQKSWRQRKAPNPAPGGTGFPAGWRIPNCCPSQNVGVSGQANSTSTLCWCAFYALADRRHLTVKQSLRCPQRSSRALTIVSALLQIMYRIFLAETGAVLGMFSVRFIHLSMIGLKSRGGWKFNPTSNLGEPNRSDKGVRLSKFELRCKLAGSRLNSWRAPVQNEHWLN